MEFKRSCGFQAVSNTQENYEFKVHALFQAVNM